MWNCDQNNSIQSVFQIYLEIPELFYKYLNYSQIGKISTIIQILFSSKEFVDLTDITTMICD